MKDNVKKIKKLVNNPKIFTSQKDKDLSVQDWDITNLNLYQKKH